MLRKTKAGGHKENNKAKQIQEKGEEERRHQPRARRYEPGKSSRKRTTQNRGGIQKGEGLGEPRRYTEGGGGGRTTEEDKRIGERRYENRNDRIKELNKRMGSERNIVKDTERVKPKEK